MKEKKSEVFIDSTPERVWEVLTNLRSWGQWNPIIHEVTGEAKPGNKLKVVIKGKGGKAGTVMKPTVTQLENLKKMVWTTSMAGGLLFKNQKVIELELSSEGTKVTHRELFGGLLPTLTWGTFKNKVEPMLNGANNGLKKHVENHNDQVQ